MPRIDQDKDFEQTLGDVADYDSFELVALMVELDSLSAIDREWVLAIASDEYEGETPNDLLRRPSAPEDRAAAWRAYFVIEALLYADRLKLSAQYVRRQKQARGGITLRDLARVVRELEAQQHELPVSRTGVIVRSMIGLISSRLLQRTWRSGLSSPSRFIARFVVSRITIMNIVKKHTLKLEISIQVQNIE